MEDIISVGGLPRGLLSFMKSPFKHKVFIIYVTFDFNNIRTLKINILQYETESAVLFPLNVNYLCSKKANN